MNIITPKVLKGTNDYGPQAMAQRLHVMRKIETIFARFGYDTIETPVIEYAETILGKYGEEGDKLTYHFHDHGDRHIALRYDQTVPFARFFASNWQELPRPFKRYQISRVWRADKPQKGRQREFYQCDIDIIGTDSLMAELEIVQVMHAVFTELELSDFCIYYNDRKFLNSLLDSAGVAPEQHLGVIRTIDKYDKIGSEKVSSELANLGLNTDSVQTIMTAIEAEGDTISLIKQLTEQGLDVSQIQTLNKSAQAANVADKIQFSPRLARGLDYYTGIIFEVVLQNAPDLGSVCGGGRYQDLCGMFTKESFSGTGVAFGFARIMTAMQEREMLDHLSTAAQVLVVNFSEELHDNQLQLAKKMRAAGLNTETYLEPAKLGKQFKYADKKGIRYVLTQGDTEVAAGVVQLKDLQTGEQAELSLDAAIAQIQQG